MSSRLGPIRRTDFIAKLKALGFHGPYQGTRHQFMVYGEYRLHIPSYSEYSVSLHSDLIGEVEAVIGRKIPRDEWSHL